jgi:tRNA1(Val) A37 N6-methylase TrmN6
MRAEITEDSILGGRLSVKQPRSGHRIGHDAILLAAACPARAGERVVDLGAGVGAAGLALAMRVADARVTLVEIDGGLAALAAENAQANGLAGRVSCAVLDATAPAHAFEAAGLVPQSVAHVLMNPPFNDPERQRSSQDPARRLAHVGFAGTLVAWTKTATRLLDAGGMLTLIWRADGLADVLRALDPAFGAVTLLPVHSKEGEPAIRILVRATKGSGAPLLLLPGFVLNDRAGHPTEAAEAVLRAGAVLPLADI